MVRDGCPYGIFLTRFQPDVVVRLVVLFFTGCLACWVCVASVLAFDLGLVGLAVRFSPCSPRARIAAIGNIAKSSFMLVVNRKTDGGL